MRRSVVVALLAAGTAYAGGDPALGKLEQSLPAGWTMLATDTELVIRHDRPVYTEGEHLPNEPADSKPTGVAGGPLITIELRYKLEPKWSAQQVADAKAANAKLGAEVRALRAKYKIDAISHPKGQPLPRNADERARVAAYTKEAAPLLARMVKLPLCTLGAYSVLDGEDTYAQLGLSVDPPEAMREAYRVVDVVKRQCGAT